MLARGEANPSIDVTEGISGALEISITTLFQEAERRHQPDRWLRAESGSRPGNDAGTAGLLIALFPFMVGWPPLAIRGGERVCAAGIGRGDVPRERPSLPFHLIPTRDGCRYPAGPMDGHEKAPRHHE